MIPSRIELIGRSGDAEICRGFIEHGCKSARNGWNLTSGHYADNYADIYADNYADNYAAGTATDPQTHERLKEYALKMFADPARRTDAYTKSEHLIALATTSLPSRSTMH